MKRTLYFLLIALFGFNTQAKTQKRWPASVKLMNQGDVLVIDILSYEKGDCSKGGCSGDSEFYLHVKLQDRWDNFAATGQMLKDSELSPMTQQEIRPNLRLALTAQEINDMAKRMSLVEYQISVQLKDIDSPYHDALAKKEFVLGESLGDLMTGITRTPTYHEIKDRESKSLAIIQIQVISQEEFEREKREQREREDRELGLL